jgi:hypothetical protein
MNTTRWIFGVAVSGYAWRIPTAPDKDELPPLFVRVRTQSHML